MSDRAGLEIVGLRKRFGAVAALDGVTLDIAPGSFFTLLGPSGCGKTTLLRAIAGFVVPDAGRIALAGQALDGLPPHRRPVNTVFQGYAVFPHMSVARNVAFGLEMQGMGRAAIGRRVSEMLALVRLSALAERRPGELSGGQQQRVALARALAPRPRVLLLDEPLSALDLKLRSEMRGELKRLQGETGITFILVTHDQHEALTLSDDVAVLREGRVEQVGAPATLYDTPATRFVADFVGEANLLPATRIGPRRFRLADGAELDAAEGGPPVAEVALVIRPERAALAAPDGATLHGRVTQFIYDGADTTWHVALEAGPVLRVRAASHGVALAVPGERVGVVVDPSAVWVVN